MKFTFHLMPAILCRRLHFAGIHSRRTPLAVIHLHTWVSFTGGQSVILQPILLQTACCCCFKPEATPDDECCRSGGSFGVSKQSYLLKLTCLEVSEPLTSPYHVGPPARHSTKLQAQVKSEVTAVMMTFLLPQTCQLQWLCLSPRQQTSDF